MAINVICLSPDGRFLFTLDDRGRILQIDLIDPSKCYTWATNFKGMTNGYDSVLDIPDNLDEIYVPVNRYLISKCKDLGDDKAGQFMEMSRTTNL